MKPILFATCVVSILQVAAALAQQSPPNEPAHKVYVMTGCLERGSASTSTFKLADATAVGQAPPGDPSSTDAESAAGTRSYDLLPVSSVSEQGISSETLESHLGNRVEVTVRPLETSIDASPTNAPSTTTAVKVDQSTPRRYTVVKIGKMPGSCQVEQGR
jgi:hypothetical protein